jgi:hypothetical protein
MLVDARWLSHDSITPQNPEKYLIGSGVPHMKLYGFVALEIFSKPVSH